MSLHHSTIVWPGAARSAVALLVLVPAAMAYPWQSMREQVVLGIAVVAVILLFGWWRGLHVTTILRRRFAMLQLKNGNRPRRRTGADVRTTALLQIAPPLTGPDLLPLPLIARYLNRYGIRADTIRITSRDTAAETETPRRTSWIGLTLSAVDNLAALQARSPRIPLRETADVAARRLADHLRELGWEAGLVAADDIPPLFSPTARETWRAVQEGSTDYVAAYQVSVDADLPSTLAAIRSHPARETWTVLEIGADGPRRTLAAACAFRTDAPPHSAPPGVSPQRGNHKAALTVLHPLSAQRLGGHARPPDGLLERLPWPSAAPAPVMVPSRHRAAGQIRAPA
ncbi:type VII secretion protein EccE [Mycobacterium botniense]|uniref:Type VII secretion protein EccE n=1 Tax=Mycobacterium botniense TaxID=84962 RepID=A0A7I9XW65_9MYCO|nr:type VII secretion protein EccE [Mycobacterium botniense]GFG74016.1 type VII secretion protein EccE [Mycobacterium botniense]